MWLKHIKFTIICILLVMIAVLTAPVVFLSKTNTCAEYWKNLKQLFSEVHKETYFD